MKKTMFITSVIMVVVMAIALTTSSLAWFSAAGNATVTTTALTVKAQSNSSTGILISLDNIDFAESVTMDASSALMPLVPLAEDASPDAAELLAALGAERFIGNKVASGLAIDPSIEEGQQGYNVASQRTIFAKSNGLSGDAVNPYRDGFYVDELYIANMATGSTGKAVYIEPSIVFQYKADSEYAAYNGSNYAATHPIMYVAVLADVTDGDVEYAVGEFVHEENDEIIDENRITGYVDDQSNAYSAFLIGGEYGNENAEYGYISRPKETWELVQVFSTASQHKDANQDYDQILSGTLAVGNLAANFESGRVISKASAAVTPTLTNNGQTSTTLAKAVNGANLGTAKKFKIVAWYDGASLNNNNSGWDFNFALTFTAHDAN